MVNSPDLGFSKDGALGIIEQLRGGAKDRLSYELIYLSIGILVKASARQGVYRPYCMQNEISVVRARRLEKSGEWFQSLGDLGPLPRGQTIKYARCHRPGRSVGYCSLYMDTALAEVRAELGQQYAIATFRMPGSSIVIPVGEFDYFRRTGRTYLGEAVEQSAKIYSEILDREDWALIALFDAFLADEFIRPVETQTDYKVTSAMAEVLFHGGLKFPEPIDAIIYPSVAFREGTNFAIRSDSFQSKIKLVESETKIIEITDVFGYGIYNYRDLMRLKSVRSDGSLDWDAVCV